MQFLKKVLDKLSGYAYRQEYLCLADEPYAKPLHAYNMQGDAIEADITHNHAFIGYCPLIMAFSATGPLQQEKEIRFSHEILAPGETLTTKQALARLKLRRIANASNNAITYYEGIEGHHKFIPKLNQFINSVNNRLYQHKAGNVYLDSKLYPQVQVAYALPRQISLISLSLDGGFNLFPTDLHGPIDRAQYIISLRQGGMACRQVQEAGKIVISWVQPGLYKQVYKLGKNHMQPVKPITAFPFSNDHSKILGLPLPQEAVSYSELELQSSFDHGIHRVLLFNEINHFHQPNRQTLRHIHNSYATWRLKHGFPGNYLFR